MNVDEAISFVKNQQAYHFAQGKRVNIPPSKKHKHEELVQKLEELSELLLDQPQDGPDEAPTVNGTASPPAQLRLGNIEDLPPEILSQLSLTEADESERQIQDVIKQEFEGVAAVDEVLVGVWRRYKIAWQRRPLASKLYRMTRKGLVHAVPKRRGLYSLTPIDGAS